MKSFGGKIVNKCQQLQPTSALTRAIFPANTVSASPLSGSVQNLITMNLDQQSRNMSVKNTSIETTTIIDVASSANNKKEGTDGSPSTHQRKKPVKPPTPVSLTENESLKQKEMKHLAHLELERSQREKKEEKKRLNAERIRLQKIKSAEGARFLKRIQAYTQFEYPSYYKITCINTAKDVERYLKHLMEREKVFGVDLEWPPSFKKGEKEKKTSLVQICSSKHILLIQLTNMIMKGDVISGKAVGFPPILRQFFQDKSIYKSGVNIYMDGLKLFRDFGIKANGLVELRDMAVLTKSPKLDICHLRSLQALTGLFLDKYLPKGSVRLSNWSNKLSTSQIKYAALDAYASYKLYRVFEQSLDSSAKLVVRNIEDEDMSNKVGPSNAASSSLPSPPLPPPLSSSSSSSSSSPSSVPARPFARNNKYVVNNRNSPTETISVIKKKVH
ncbi:ribonuclease H-like domain-containing protein [Mycotypha africana]|uniref:ribonuclease H-like domain-containing protein n=1 Tax=Mycotypha africana TaxID=64632 RepID=UPI00230046D8|nr:ribonuclease H-like domain-containing protein [Mycotypha africana]KAI8988620.1 ribonuclease H-like domain-containing protein [Mycotypha africana]